MAIAVQASGGGRAVLPTIQDVAKKAEDKIGFVNKFVGTARAAAAFANSIEPVSKDVLKGIGQTQFLGVAEGLFEVPKLFSHVADVIEKEKPQEKIESAGKAVLSASKVAGTAGAFAKALQSTGAVAKEAVAWTGPLGLALLPFQGIAVLQGGHAVYKAGEGKYEIDKFKDPKPTDSHTTRTNNVALGLAKLYSEAPEKLESRFEVDKSEKLQKRIGTLLQKVAADRSEEQEMAVAKGEKVMQELKKKASRSLGFEILATALKIVAFVSAVVALCVPPILIAAATTALVTSAIGLGIYLYRRYKLSKKVEAFAGEIEAE